MPPYHHYLPPLEVIDSHHSPSPSPPPSSSCSPSASLSPRSNAAPGQNDCGDLPLSLLATASSLSSSPTSVMMNEDDNDTGGRPLHARKITLLASSVLPPPPPLPETKLLTPDTLKKQQQPPSRRRLRLVRTTSSLMLAYVTTLKLLYGATGITMAYLYYGHVQESLFSYQDSSGLRFTAAWTLTFLESSANVVLGLIVTRWCNRHCPTREPTHRQLNMSIASYFYASGVSQLLAKAFTSLSLAAGLSFPVCTLTKCCKMAPVMLGQWAVGGSAYGICDYVAAACLIGGTALLSLGTSSSHANGGGGSRSSTTPLGLTCIMISLFMDGATAGLQKRLKCVTASWERPPTTYDFLLYTNASMAVTSYVIAYLTGDLYHGWYCWQHVPALRTWMLTACCCSAIGQSFIFFVVHHFDPQVCSTVTTTRKMGSVLWSLAVRGHAVTHQGATGILLACAGLALEVRCKMHEYATTKRLLKRKQNDQALPLMSPLAVGTTHPGDAPTTAGSGAHGK